MNKTITFLVSLVILVLNLQFNLQAQTIEQKLVIVQNDQTIGGTFSIQVQVKGTSLPAANTLGSATIDIQYNNTHIALKTPVITIGATNWAFGSSLGYARSATDNITSIRVGVLGSSVNGDGGGVPPGFDIGSTYTSWVQLNFTILAATTTSLTIDNATNAIGLFDNYQNNPNTGAITNQPLTAPENIVDVGLPVELSAFNAKYDEKGKVDLNWVTKTEVSNYGFYVERCINEGEWNSLTFIEGHGNSNSPKEYNYSDKDLFAGGSKFQYRLKQVDTDGKYEYSDVVEVEIMPTKFELSQNYPNPFNPSTTIQFSLPKATQLKINIYNMIGELVRTLADGNYDAGYHKVTLNAIDLPSGAYVYRIESPDFVQVKKMILIK
jgi:hypothetical protein